MFISPTAPNAGLASAVNNRIRADGLMIAAKSVLWRLAGIGALCLMTGCGIGAALFGYSYVTNSRTSADKMANAFAVALDHANLGTVRINPDSVVKLDSNAMVRLDPDATVKVEGPPLDFPRPTEQQLHAGTPPANAKIVTNYTIFKEIEFGKGKVETGWLFSSSTQDLPDGQFCYYTVLSSDGSTSLRFELGNDGRFAPGSNNNNLNVDATAAFQRCVWFR